MKDGGPFDQVVSSRSHDLNERGGSALEGQVRSGNDGDDGEKGFI